MSISAVLLVLAFVGVLSWQVWLLVRRWHSHHRAIDEYIHGSSRIRRTTQPPLARVPDPDPRQETTRKMPALSGPVFHDSPPPPKDTPMPRLADNEEAPRTATAYPGDAEHSLNDVAKLREQDQAVAQLAAQLERMDSSPWVVKEIGSLEIRATNPESDYTTTKALGDHPIKQLSSQLNKMMNPPAAAGSQAAMTGVGTINFVNIGNRVVICNNKEHVKEALDRLNSDYFRIIGPIRKKVLADLHRYATDSAARFDKRIGLTRLWIVECQQTRVPCESQREAEEIEKLLSDAYYAVTKSSVKMVLAELAAATKPGVGMALDHQLDEHDPKYNEAAG